MCLACEISKAIGKIFDKTTIQNWKKSKGFCIIDNQNFKITSSQKKLHCSHIAHMVVIPVDDPLYNQSVSLNLFEVFKAVDKYGMSSIAIPTIGAGKLSK